MISFSLKPKFNQEAALVLLTQSQRHPRLHKTLDKGEVFPVVHDKFLYVFLGLGDASKLSLTELRIQIRKALMNGYLSTYKNIELIPHNDDESAVTAIIEGILLGTYVWDKYKTKAKDDKSIKDKNITIIAKPSKVYSQTIDICSGVNLTRNLVNDNADTVTSTHIESIIKGLVKGKSNIRLEILNKKELKAKGLNLHLAVNQGSLKEPKLIIVKYSAGKSSEGYTAVIGKGITFDTGGLNLKLSGNIETMKIDMAGAAAVCGILNNVVSLGLKKNLIFVFGLAENAIGSAAYKPGDVYTGYAGKSVEIGNTDAEGRLVLADAISYVVKNYKPTTMIDLATLTGACVVALGFDYTGLFSNNDDFAKQLVDSARKTDDRAWHMPLYPEIKDYIKSQIADLKNTSNIKGGGACTAAEFLNSFTNGTTWAHLDIAGTSYVEGANRMYFGHGATGAGVRLVTHYLLNN